MDAERVACVAIGLAGGVELRDAHGIRRYCVVIVDVKSLRSIDDHSPSVVRSRERVVC